MSRGTQPGDVWMENVPATHAGVAPDHRALRCFRAKGAAASLPPRVTGGAHTSVGAKIARTPTSNPFAWQFQHRWRTWTFKGCWKFPRTTWLSKSLFFPKATRNTHTHTHTHTHARARMHTTHPNSKPSNRAILKR